LGGRLLETEARDLRAFAVVVDLVEDEARWCETTPRALDANLVVNIVISVTILQPVLYP
jgi:hypothetical protein